MKCKFCEKKLRKDNTIGTCRVHRSLSDSRKIYMLNYANDKHIELAHYKKTWAQEHRNQINKRSAERRKTEVNFKLAHSLRNRLNRALQGTFKSTSIIKALGCSIEELKQHLEKQFTSDMNWTNHTRFGWHIDHIIPLHSVDLTDPEQFQKVNHFTNLRPLWWRENIQRNRIKNSQE